MSTSYADHDALVNAFVTDVVQRKHWSYDHIVHSHTGLSRVDHGVSCNFNPRPWFYKSTHPGARPNPTDGYLTLHQVSGPEFSSVEAMASTEPFGGVVASVLRVQNYLLMDTFTRFIQPGDALCVGFHATETKCYLENVLLNGLNPSMSGYGTLGVGSYIATHAERSIDGYASLFRTPMYTDCQDQNRIDRYKFVTLFCCNKGKRVLSGSPKRATLPQGCGAFVDIIYRPRSLCFQEYERLCPAYVLVCRMTTPEYGESDEHYAYHVKCALERGDVPDTSGNWCWSSETTGLRVFESATGLSMAVV
jgi:hypothetical protein